MTQVLVKEFLLEPIKHRCCTPTSTGCDGQGDPVTVAIRLKGEPKGVKVQGGVVDFPHREVEVECLPAETSRRTSTIDVSELMIGEGVRLKDLSAGCRSGRR